MLFITNIPHRMAHGMCPINGIRDLVQWRLGCDWSNEFLFGLAQGGGFAYLRFSLADPPRQVYWGSSSPRQHKYSASLLGGQYSEIEGRTFKHTWRKAQDAIGSGKPAILGPLDMYHLPFYPEIYHLRHIPIHYLLLVGFEHLLAFVLDTDHECVQTLPIEELELAWQVNVPGLGKKNRFVVIDLPQKIPPVQELIKQSIVDECKLMLTPPVSFLGIPAMEKLSREITTWPNELGAAVTEKCLNQVREYLSSPPDLYGSHLTAGRDRYIQFLEEVTQMTGLGLSAPISKLLLAVERIPHISSAIERCDLQAAAGGFARIATLEKEAYTMLAKLFIDT